MGFRKEPEMIARRGRHEPPLLGVVTLKTLGKGKPGAASEVAFYRNLSRNTFVVRLSVPALTRQK